MADPLSVSTSILALLQVTRVMISYLKDIHDAPKDHLSLLAELSSLEALLDVLHIRVQEAKSGDPWLTEVRTLGIQDGPLDQFQLQLEKIISKLEPVNRIRDIGKRLTWTFDKARIRDALSKIERIKTLTLCVLTHDHYSLTLAIKADSIKIVETVTTVQAGISEIHANHKDEEYRKMIDWISPLNFKLSHKEIFQKQESGTGKWFLQSSEFNDWCIGKVNTLWCFGIPGAGKTVLSSIVVNYLKTTFKDHNDIVVTYIYCNYKEQTEQTAFNLITSLLKQLVQASYVKVDVIESLYRLHEPENTIPTMNDIMTVFISAVEAFTKVFMIIDALDESCEETREKLLWVFQSLPNSVKLMVTSRDHLSFLVRDFQGATQVDIHANDEDVERYVKGRIDRSLPSRSHLKKYQPQIIKQVLENIRGMFLLAQLHMDSLETKPNLAAVKRALENLPKSVETTYDEVMDRIELQSEDDTNLAKQVFLWITHACRPLTMKELQHALAITPGANEIDIDNITNEEILLSVCAGLVFLDEESNVVRLVHYTAQQYFEHRQESLFPSGHTHIARICLTYLSFDIFEQGYCEDNVALESFIESNPLLTYAAQYWVDHMHGEQEETIKNMILMLSQHEPKVTCTSQVLQRKPCWGYFL